jgi:hypothetical protein
LFDIINFILDELLTIIIFDIIRLSVLCLRRPLIKQNQEKRSNSV